MYLKADVETLLFGVKSVAVAKVEADKSGQLLLTQGDYDLCNAMSENALRNPTLAKQIHDDDANI